MPYVVDGYQLGLVIDIVDGSIVSYSNAVQAFRASQFDRVAWMRIVCKGLEPIPNAYGH